MNLSLPINQNRQHQAYCSLRAIALRNNTRSSQDKGYTTEYWIRHFSHILALLYFNTVAASCIAVEWYKLFTRHSSVSAAQQ